MARMSSVGSFSKGMVSAVIDRRGYRAGQSVDQDDALKLETCQ